MLQRALSVLWQILADVYWKDLALRINSSVNGVAYLLVYLQAAFY